MDLIENLYAAFADVPKPARLQGCTLGCCMPKKDELQLLGQNLRDTTPELLWHYIEDAIWTVGDKYDFKYYVPRLLELGLTLYDGENFHGNFIACPQTLGKKLALADFDDWGLAKRETVGDAILAIMGEDARRKDFFNCAGWMTAICYINIDKKRYLDFLDSDEGKDARDYFLVHQRDAYEYGRMKGAFWDELAVEQTDVIYQWLVLRKKQSDIALGKHRRRRRGEGLSDNNGVII